ncbi:MAG: hypothetical protein M3P97_09135 [Actinomycetota bacterium]|nr:hypothetical protein [Actinomycetota bacterium]
MHRLPKPWEPGASARQRYVPLAAAVVIVAVLVYALLPFTFAGTIECSSALLGSQADPATPAGAIVGNADTACADTGGRRLVNAAVIGAAALVLGLAGAFLPSDLPSDEDTPGG